VSAEVTEAGDLIVTSIVGDDLSFEVSGGVGNVDIIGGTDVTEPPLNLNAALAADDNQSIVVGGIIDVVAEEGYSVKGLDPVFSGLFTELAIRNAEPFTINAFDPNDPATYNHSTSLSIFDSLGESHVMTQYFVKQEFDPNDPTKNEANVWKMYVLIDDADVGDPDTSLPPPENTLPTRAEFTLRFNPDGTLDTESSSELLISNWTPLNAEGDQSGAMGPLNRLEGGKIPVEDPATSSNFEIDMGNTTQFSSAFAVNSVDQNGFTTGLLTGIDIDDGGVIYARFTNGESVALSKLALANFENPQGLQPLGDSVWAENFESGEALIASAGTGSLGLVQAGALEESNVDLSEQLVNLIVAQRNFQANAKTIETANQITQTIINLR
ncbi:MAG TPA: flagellar hook-basal body complex protein, partial [Pseudomonadales bacterium]|nr:flagellar hook-basal body complex protein [Pseudomonadales bacterium]